MDQIGNSRRVALSLLQSVVADHAMLSEAEAKVMAQLSPSDRARAHALATGTLRDAGKADRLIGHYLRQRPPVAILNILRLGVHELMGQGAAHGVVNEMVALAKSSPETGRMAGLVNAVLRNILRRPAVDWAGLAPSPLPKALRKKLVGHWGKDRVADFEQAWSVEPPLDLTPRDGDAAALAAATGGTVLPTGSVRLARPGQVSALPGFAEGGFWVQDAAAALPARLIAQPKGARVLDLCAAPGGKTLQLAAAGAEVTAVDLSESRMTRLRDNLTRTRLTAEVLVADALTYRPDQPFDAVLIDAPCSATGTIRRHPDLPFARPDPDITPLLDLQAKLIDHAVSLLRPGGQLVYCTCSLFPDEGEAQLAAALARHPNLSIDRDAEANLALPEAIRPEGGLRTAPDLWPELGGMDGFFMVALRVTSG